MAILRIDHDSNYSCISNSLTRDKRLSFKAKGILCYMLTCKDSWDFNISGISNMSTDGRDSVRSGLKELEEFGYLEVKKHVPDSQNGGRITYEYIVHETPLR